MPLGTSLFQIGVNLAVVAFCSNAIYVCGSSGVSKTYGKLLGPKVSLMDAAFGLGATFAPLLDEVVAAFGYGAVEGYRVLACVDVALLCGAVSLLLYGRLKAKGHTGEAEEAEMILQEQS